MEIQRLEKVFWTLGGRDDFHGVPDCFLLRLCLLLFLFPELFSRITHHAAEASKTNPFKAQSS
jgi:hypothetical protein